MLIQTGKPRGSTETLATNTPVYLPPGNLVCTYSLDPPHQLLSSNTTRASAPRRDNLSVAEGKAEEEAVVMTTMMTLGQGQAAIIPRMRTSTHIH